MQHGKYRFIAGFLVVPLALYAIFVIWPFVQSIYYSFTDWTGLSPDFTMVGFDNYSRMLDDDIFWKSLQHSVLLALLLPLVTLGLALFFAFMLNVGGRRRKNAAVAGVRASSSSCSRPGWRPSRRTSTRPRCSTARTASRPSSRSRCRCSGTPCSPAGSTWASWRSASRPSRPY